MNAPANITIADIDGECWSREERIHRAAISMHCPNQNEVAMQCRVHIAMIRDQAGAGLSRCSEASFDILTGIARVATPAVYAPSDTKRLVLLRAALTQAMEAARAIERATTRKHDDNGAG